MAAREEYRPAQPSSRTTLHGKNHRGKENGHQVILIERTDNARTRFKILLDLPAMLESSYTQMLKRANRWKQGIFNSMKKNKNKIDT